MIRLSSEAEILINMRVLAIDFGLKRTGLAVTDPARIIASALETVQVQLRASLSTVDLTAHPTASFLRRVAAA